VTRSLPSLRALAVAALLGGVLLQFPSPPPAQSAARAQTSNAAAPACTLNGPRWTIYDNHGGANPKQVGAGTSYNVTILVFQSPSGYSCAQARAAVRKMFAETMGKVGPPETGSAGSCKRLAKVGTGGVFFSWAGAGLH
jgi:hypothetical protein